MIEIVKNTPKQVNLLEKVNSRGYTLNTSSVSHEEGYNNAPLVVKTYNFISGNTYTISFSLTGTDSTTSVSYSAGGVSSPQLNDDNYIQSTFTATNTDNLTFVGSGNFTISNLNILRVGGTSELTGNETITFSQEKGKWVTYKSLTPDCGFSIYTNLFTYKNGVLWKHTKDAVPNNFYGVQYNSILKFPISSQGVKTYGSISVHANKVLSTTLDGVKTQLGQVSDLIVEDFQTKEGVHSAVFLRDKLTG